MKRTNNCHHLYSHKEWALYEHGSAQYTFLKHTCKQHSTILSAKVTHFEL